MTRVKIYGAGSVGNHLTHAARQMGWDVVVCDVCESALKRMRTEIYPSRYGDWDEDIKLYLNHDAPSGGFDLICIGTPPEWHVPLALEGLREEPKSLLIEKPLCPPSMNLAQDLREQAKATKTRVYVGYDHVVGRGVRQAEELIRSGTIGQIKSLDVDFREHWSGIFNAHPWLSGPEDSYLGYWQLGGGASGEHSHATNLWQHFAHIISAGRVVEVDATLSYIRDGKAWYDELCLLNLRTEFGLVGRVVQDVVTIPSRKRAHIQGTEGAIEWVSNSPEEDIVRLLRPGKGDDVKIIRKKRPDDFIDELKHLQSQWEQPARPSPISLDQGLDTMLVIAAAHRSEAVQGRIRIDYSAGYVPEALKSVGALKEIDNI
jgi:predicted dehydrogenase